MKPEEFIEFQNERPVPNKYLIVTNNLNAKNAHGEMANVWMTTFITENKDNGFLTYDDAGRAITNLSHWKYV